MRAILEALARHARFRPDVVALAGGRPMTWRELHGTVHRTAERLAATGIRCAGLLADNGNAWVIADLAAYAAGICMVPVPSFFSAAQQRHVLDRAGADALILDPGFCPPVDVEPLSTMHGLHVLAVDGTGSFERPPGTGKITFTSGTTGQPKGVCLGPAQIERVAEALCSASGAGPDDVHLGTMPLSTLLENIGGVYAPILAGATIVHAPLATVGLIGVTRLEPARLVRSLCESGATTAILVPQLLHGLLQGMSAGPRRPDRLRFVAVGGAPIGSALLEQASQAGVPVFEGYGLSECASVVSLNRPGASRRGAAGRPLRHLDVSISSGGEIVVAGTGFLGYAGEPIRSPLDPVATGDLGKLDDDGFLHVTGRRKSMFITAFGRNVSPEWIESELCAHPAIAQAAVFGEARPWPSAVIVPRTSRASVDAAIASVNAGLPDYACVRRWLVADEPFGHGNEQITSNGRLRRERVAEIYATRLHSLYEESAR